MMWHPGKPMMLFAPEGTAGASAGDSGAAAGAAAGAGSGAAGAGVGAGGATPQTAAPWHDGIEPATVGFWQNKGLDPADPKKVAVGLTKFYREIETMIGAPPSEMIRIPKPNATPSDIAAYWQRIGVPAEAKDYDLSTVKFTDGKELAPDFVEMFRSAAHGARVPKEQATPLLTALVKHMEKNDAAELAETTAKVNAEKEALSRNWGTNRGYNEAIAKHALEELGRVSGLTAEQTTAAWDALSKVGGIGASSAMEMLRIIGARMGEAPFIGAKAGEGGSDPAVMSKQQAMAEIESLKKDKAFYKALIVDKSVEANRRWTNLHKIAFAA